MRLQETSPASVARVTFEKSGPPHTQRSAPGGQRRGRNVSGGSQLLCVASNTLEAARDGFLARRRRRMGDLWGLETVLQARRIPPSKRGIPGIPEAQKSMWNPWNPSWNPCYHSAQCDCHAVRRQCRVTTPATAVPVFGIRTQWDAVGCLDVARGCP